MPPLRDRASDIPSLVAAILDHLGDRDVTDGARPRRRRAAAASSSRHAWPGNVRELRNYVERCLAGQPTQHQDVGSDEPAIDITQSLRAVRERWVHHVERQYLERLLAAHHGNVERGGADGRGRSRAPAPAALEARPPVMWKAVLREPLVHFVVLGGVLFAADRLREHDAPAPPPAPSLVAPAPTTGPIVVDVARETAVAQRRLGRAPTPVEVEAEIQRFVDEEILFREALARGLERDDPMIHERIASRMATCSPRARSSPSPPTRSCARGSTRTQSEYAAPERIDFTHVFVRGDDTARAERSPTSSAPAPRPTRSATRSPVAASTAAASSPTSPRPSVRVRRRARDAAT